MSVPLVVRLPRGRRGGSVCDALVPPEDLFSTLCGLCGVDVPRTVSGRNQADVWLGLVVLSLILFGDGLHDSLDPTLHHQ